MSRIATVLRGAPTAVFGSTAARQREVETADRIIRAPLSLSHRIAFVQLVGGTGASAVSAYVGGLLAHRRPGAVLAANASGGERTLLWHAGLSSSRVGAGADAEPTDAVAAAAAAVTAAAAAEDAAAASRRRPTSFADASAGLARTPTGLYTLDVRRGPGLVAATETDWATPIAPISRFFDVVCTDFGVRRPELDLGGIAAGNHAVCIVSRADRTSLEEALAVVPALRALPGSPRVVVAAVDIGGTAGRAADVVRWGRGSRIVEVPFDAARSGDAPVSSTDLSTRSRLALTLLAAALLPQPTTSGQNLRPSETGARP